MAYRSHHNYAALSDDDENLKHLKLAVLGNPRCTDARNDLALAMYRRGCWGRSVDEFQRCLEIDPNHALSHKNIAAVYASQGRYDDAIRHSEAAVRLNPGDVMAHRNLARLYDYARGDSRKAMDHNDCAVRLGPGAHGVPDPRDLADANAYRRQAILRVGQGHKAHDFYDQFRALAGKSFTLPNSHTTTALLLKARQSNLL